MKNNLQKALILTVIAAISILMFSYSSKKHNTTEDLPCSRHCNEVNEKKNQSDVPFLESLTRHLLALNH